MEQERSLSPLLKDRQGNLELEEINHDHRKKKLVDHLVAQYLVKRGLSDTAKAFAKETELLNRGSYHMIVPSFQYYNLTLDQCLDRALKVDGRKDASDLSYKQRDKLRQRVMNINPDEFGLLASLDFTSILNDEKQTQVLLMMYQEFSNSEQLLHMFLQLYFKHGDKEDKLNVLKSMSLWMKFLYLRFDRFECNGVPTATHIVKMMNQFIQAEMNSLTFLASESIAQQELIEQLVILQTVMQGNYGKKSILSSSDLLSWCVKNRKCLNGQSVFQMKPRVVAYHLTIIEFNKFAAIQPQEFLNLHWSKAKYRKRSPNLLRFIQRFNSITNWVASMIVEPHSLDERIQRVEFFVSVALELWELNHFNAVQAILSAFRNNAVSRLQQTFDGVRIHYIEGLSSLREDMKKQGNYSKYRQILASIYEEMKSNINGSITKTCCIPFLGMYLSDLVFTEEGNPTTPFFTRAQMTYEVIERIMTFQHNTGDQEPASFCRYLANQCNLQSHLLVVLESLEGRITSEEELSKTSCEREKTALRVNPRSSSPRTPT